MICYVNASWEPPDAVLLHRKRGRASFRGAGHPRHCLSVPTHHSATLRLAERAASKLGEELNRGQPIHQIGPNRALTALL